MEKEKFNIVFHKFYIKCVKYPTKKYINQVEILKGFLRNLY